MGTLTRSVHDEGSSGRGFKRRSVPMILISVSRKKVRVSKKQVHVSKKQTSVPIQLNESYDDAYKGG